MDWEKQVLSAALLVLLLGVLLLLIRIVKGPSFADRLLGLSMLGTLTLMAIVLLSVLLRQDYLLDIALVLALLNFLAVAVLCKLKRRERRQGTGRKER